MPHESNTSLMHCTSMFLFLPLLSLCQVYGNMFDIFLWLGYHYIVAMILYKIMRNLSMISFTSSGIFLPHEITDSSRLPMKIALYISHKYISQYFMMKRFYMCRNRNKTLIYMITSSNGNIFRVTSHLCGECTGPLWIPHTKASNAELWCLLWSAPEYL